MVNFFFCRNCGRDAGTKDQLCLDCDSKVGIPRFGRRTLELSRQAASDALAKSRAKPLDEVLKNLEAKRIGRAARKDGTVLSAVGSGERKNAAGVRRAVEAQKAAEAALRERKKAADIRRAAEAEAKKAATAARKAMSARPPAPPAFPYGVSPEGAEHLVADWMRHLGATDVSVTSFQSDGGIDVQSNFHAAQVKLYATTNVGRPEIQQLVGAALVNQRNPLFFTSSAYTAEAKRFADQAEVALFKIVPEAGTLLGANSLGIYLRDVGLA